MLRLASDGATPEEIAERLGVPLETAQCFIDKFVALPDGFDTMLLRAPSLLSKRSQMRSMLRGAIKRARRK